MRKQKGTARPVGGADACLAAPERSLLECVLGSDNLAQTLAGVPGGWRTQSEHELRALGLGERDRRAVLSLQELVRRGFPELPRRRFGCSDDVGHVFGARLGGLVNEVMLAIALDGRNNAVAELEIAVGGAHGLCVTARDILRPLIRAGASAFVLVHNHPSGDPTPSPEDIHMTRAIAAAAELVGIPLVDHIVVGARDGGFASLLDLGLLATEPSLKELHEERHLVSAVSR